MVDEEVVVVPEGRVLLKLKVNFRGILLHFLSCFEMMVFMISNFTSLNRELLV